MGVRLFSSKSEYESAEAREAINAIPYCVALECSSRGHAIKFSLPTSKCPGASRALGLTPPSRDYHEGTSAFELGLYRDVEVAAHVAQEMKNADKHYYGVEIKPALQFRDSPDVFIVVDNAMCIMRIVQGHSYHFASTNNFAMRGNQAFCVELTTTPLNTDEINVSLLCSGTRYSAGWDESELAVGIPRSCVAKVADGVRQSANATEPDERKTLIRNALRKIGDLAPDICDKEAYYHLQNRKNKQRKESNGQV